MTDYYGLYLTDATDPRYDHDSYASEYLFEAAFNACDTNDIMDFYEYQDMTVWGWC